MKQNEEGRNLLLQYLKNELIGPVSGAKEELQGEAPHKRYTLGILFPVNSSEDTELADEESETSGVSADELSEDPITLSGQWMPSSMGVSFYAVGSPEIEVNVWGSRYLKVKESASGWIRKTFAEESKPFAIIISPDKSGRSEVKVFDGCLKVLGRWRKLGSGFLITVTIVNTIEKSGIDVKGEDCLCQSGFKCRMSNGKIYEYPSVRIANADPEEQELQILYRHKKVFAAGHGCSADWENESDNPEFISTQVMPIAFIASMTHDLDESPEILKVSRLADQSLNKLTVIGELEKFTGLFEKWIGKLKSDPNNIPERLHIAQNKIISRLEISLKRMYDGILCLRNDEVAWNAFQLANLAMLMQMRHSESDFAGSIKKRNVYKGELPDYFKTEYKWRPFQLAFQLLTIESLINQNSEYRDTVDLIWFPTGGGKTEAYLAVAAFEIMRRRLKLGESGGGTSVITRYTLRLLTSQQFQRSSRLITACEYLRRQDVGRLGREPITIGFWAGESTSPNTYDNAVKGLSEIRESSMPNNKNRFQISSCPWCGTELLPENISEDDNDFGFRCTNNLFHVYCPSDNCAFHNFIPVSVVDEDLYRKPPTFLIATVDKFARMSWVGDAGVFFGSSMILPPSLIIQDELHLLSGPLGTTVGIYESAFDGLMQMKGIRAKVIASTATIRSADSQIKSLFARKVMLFPSPGLNSDDSFFARTDNKKKGRLYIGIMSSNHRATTSVVRTAAALLQGVEEIETLTEEEKNGYWTLVIYHMSLRELGKTVSFSRDDIPARMKVISSARDKTRKIDDANVIELTSNLRASEIPDSLRRMERHYKIHGSVSILACTNMLSVGVDVPRLGLMLINGQPKTTSEYIQASSRVGRGSVPGVVITHYSASKPRDRSHYESFLPYHSSIYRFVEPSSVTPFSLPARNRALHAAFVIMIRHGAGMSKNEDAAKFIKDDPNVVKAFNILCNQAQIKDPQEYFNTRIHLERIIEKWDSMARESKATGYLLYYHSNSKQNLSLLKNYEEAGEGWTTLNSMRSVDSECRITVLGEK